MQHSAPEKSATGKNTNFALDGYSRFMKPSWVRALGLIFGESYIVWVCAPPYSSLSSPRSRIRENSALKFGPKFVTLSGGILYLVVFFNSVHPVLRPLDLVFQMLANLIFRLDLFFAGNPDKLQLLPAAQPWVTTVCHASFPRRSLG